MLAELIRIGLVAAGMGAGGLLFHAYNIVIDNPTIVRIERARCVAEVEAAAAQATRDEQLRQFRIGEAASNAAIAAEREAADWHAAELEVMKREIAQYAAERQRLGRACTLDRDDLDFLGGLQQQRPAGPGGS